MGGGKRGPTAFSNGFLSRAAGHSKFPAAGGRIPLPYLFNEKKKKHGSLKKKGEGPLFFLESAPFTTEDGD